MEIKVTKMVGRAQQAALARLANKVARLTMSALIVANDNATRPRHFEVGGYDHYDEDGLTIKLDYRITPDPTGNLLFAVRATQEHEELLQLFRSELLELLQLAGLVELARAIDPTHDGADGFVRFILYPDTLDKIVQNN